MTRGRFIALEGGEGAGKSTQARLLAQALAARGIETVLTREPGGTPLAEAIRALLLGEGEGPGLRAEALLFAAARSDHVARLIAPALDAGKWVVCDRFLDSSRAYQGGGGGLPDADILALHRIGSGGLLPDLAILVEVDPTAMRPTGSADATPPITRGLPRPSTHSPTPNRSALSASTAMALPNRPMRLSWLHCIRGDG
jgi:dTMP kinase